MALEGPLCSFYITKLGNIIDETNALIDLSDTAIRDFIAASENGPQCAVNPEILYATTTSKTNLSSLRDAAFRTREALGVGGIPEADVVMICSLWQQRQDESRYLLRYLDAQKLERDTVQASEIFFEHLVSNVIDGEKSLPSRPLGLRCRMRSISLVRRLRRVSILPPHDRGKAIRMLNGEIATVLELHISYLFELQMIVDENLCICESLRPVTERTDEKRDIADNAANEVGASDVWAESVWSREWCSKHLEGCRKAVRELLGFAINAKCKAEFESLVESGSLLLFCSDAHAVADMTAKLKQFIVPAVSIRSGLIPENIFEQVEAFVQTRYLGGLWSDGRGRGSSLSGEAFEAWLQWFLDGSGWNGDEVLPHFYSVWVEGVARREPFAKRVVDYFSAISKKFLNKKMIWGKGVV